MLIPIFSELSFFYFIFYFNPVRADVSESLVWPGGGRSAPPLEIHEGVVWDPLLLFRSYTSIKIEITWGISGRNLKNWVRFHDLKIWRNWDFALGWLTKIPVTRSIFEIRDSSFGIFLIFMFVRNHILQLRLYDQFSNFSFF